MGSNPGRRGGKVRLTAWAMARPRHRKVKENGVMGPTNYTASHTTAITCIYTDGVRSSKRGSCVKRPWRHRLWSHSIWLATLQRNIQPPSSGYPTYQIRECHKPKGGLFSLRRQRECAAVVCLSSKCMRHLFSSTSCLPQKAQKQKRRKHLSYFAPCIPISEYIGSQVHVDIFASLKYTCLHYIRRDHCTNAISRDW
jgi:hypothetical protein